MAHYASALHVGLCFSPFIQQKSFCQARLALTSFGAPPFAGSRTPTAPGLEGRFLPVTPCGLIPLRTHSGGRPPAASRGRNWSLQADPTLTVLQHPIEKRRASHCEIRLKFSRSSPVPSPSAFGLTPFHPKLSCFVLARDLAAQNLPAPWLVKSSGGEGITPAGADRLAGACISVLPNARGGTVIPDRQRETIRRPAC